MLRRIHGLDWTSCFMLFQRKGNDGGMILKEVGLLVAMM